MITQEQLEKKGLRIDEKTGKFLFGEEVQVQNPRFYIEKERPVAPTSGPIYPLYRAMTANKVTQNFTYYPYDQLVGDKEARTGLVSWVQPYEMPIILNHLMSPGWDGQVSDPQGRIIGASMASEKTKDGEIHYLALAGRVNDADCIEKTLDRRYLTMSIGVLVDAAYCSVCGINQREDYCDHYRGQWYDHPDENGNTTKKLCYYIMAGIHGREISYVNAPSDDEAHVEIPDMGETGVKAWLKAAAVVSPTWQEAKRDIPIVPALYSAQSVFTPTSMVFSESAGWKSLLRENMSTTTTEVPTPEEEQAAEETPVIEETPVEAPAPAEEPASSEATPEPLETVEQIIQAAVKIAADPEKATDEEITRVKTAYREAGIDPSCVFRLDLGHEGKARGAALIKKEGADWPLLRELASAIEGSDLPENLEENTIVPLTVDNLSVLLTKAVETIKAAREAVKSVNETSYESQYHSLLVTVVANELVRSNAARVRGKTAEEIHSSLKERSIETLTAQYQDMVAESFASPTETLGHPVYRGVEANRSATGLRVASLEEITRVARLGGGTVVTNEDGSREIAAQAEDGSDGEEIVVDYLPNGTMQITSKPVLKKATLEELIGQVETADAAALRKK